MSHTIREKTKLLHRVRRLRGQLLAVERALEEEAGCGSRTRRSDRSADADVPGDSGAHPGARATRPGGRLKPTRSPKMTAACPSATA
ncbi:MAG TPA: metal-sensing transcriptional repressor, partial [Candidatus Binataceae bacterium]|nr:metal-sensing transcriptional repressor [Candidatus Binataceae bacterium]